MSGTNQQTQTPPEDPTKDIQSAKGNASSSNHTVSSVLRKISAYLGPISLIYMGHAIGDFSSHYKLVLFFMGLIAVAFFFNYYVYKVSSVDNLGLIIDQTSTVQR